MKTKSGWLTFAEAPSGDTPGAVLLATSGYLLCRSADEKVLLVREQDTFGVGLVDAKSLAWYRREGNVPGTVAFESAASPGSFLTHSNYRMYTSANSKEGLACTFYAVA